MRWRLRNRNIENQSLLLAVRIILEQVVGDELNRVGWPELMRIIPFLGELGECLQHDRDDRVVKVLADWHGAELLGLIQRVLIRWALLLYY